MRAEPSAVPTARPAGERRRRAARLLGRLALALLAATAALEIGLRLFGHSPREEAPYRFSATKGWELRPSPGAVNALGFRGPEIEVPKPAGTLRVAVLGDSFTYGLGVPPEAAFPAALGRALREEEPARRIEVVNAGVPGYGTAQEAIHLEERVLPLGPDEVLLGFFLNDAQPWRPPAAGPLGSLLFHLRRTSAILLYLRRRAVRAGRRSEMDLQEADRIGRTGDPDWIRCREALARMAGVCRERGIPFRMVLWPHLRNLRDYPFLAAHEALARAAEEIGFPCLDLRSLFADASPEDLLASPDNPHPNAATHERAARAIAEWRRTPR